VNIKVKYPWINLGHAMGVEVYPKHLWKIRVGRAYLGSCWKA